VDCFTFYCLPELVPVPRLGKKGLVKCHMSASQMLNAPTYSGSALADAGPNARPRRGAPLSSDFMTSSCLVNRVTIGVERRSTVKH